MSMFLPKDTPVMAQYKSIKSQYPDCLLFFRLGDFYELFFQDAEVASKELDIVLTARHKNSAQEIPMCGVPFHASENYIARLVKKGYKVAICEQLETPQSKEGKGPVKRDVVRVITAGTLLEDTLLNPRQHNFLAAVCPQDGLFALAYVDISTGEFWLESYTEKELEEVFSSLSPKEILVPEKGVSQDHSLWNSWRQFLTILPNSRFDALSCEERLCQFFQVNTSKALGSFSKAEGCAAGVLVDYVLLTQKRQVLKLNCPKRNPKGSLLRLDPFTRNNLELFQNFSGSKEFSLLQILDNTLTPFGARLLHWRLSHPICDLNALQVRLNCVEYFVQSADQRAALRSLLKGMPDMERIISRLLTRRGTPRDLLSVLHVLKIFPKIHQILLQNVLPTELEDLPFLLSLYDDLTDKLSRGLVADESASLLDGDVIAPGYWPDLDELRRLYQKQEEVLEALQNQYIQETQISTLKIRHNKIIGHHIEISPSFAAKMPYQFILRQSLVSCLRYTTEELLELAKKLESARGQALLLEQEIFDQFLEDLAAVHGDLKNTFKNLAVLDVTLSFAEIAVQRHYTRPKLDNSDIFEVIGGRHPVLEVAFFTHQKGTFIKNDCYLDRQAPLWLMTGPNMAGKSTFLRQNALIGLMAHIGSFVPAQQAHIGMIDRIFSRVGASDDLSRGHSTFMLEMIETACILNQATAKSFVIFDEVGRGTSTYDGLSLAWACVEHVLDHIRCRTLFATHYHELAAVQQLRPAIQLYTFKVQEWNKQIVFFHEVIPGKVDRSYGLHVAKLAGIPETLLNRAQQILNDLEERGNNVKYSLF